MTRRGSRAPCTSAASTSGNAAITALYNDVVNGVPLPAETIANTTLVDPTNWQDSGLVCTA